ncbi:MAG TPA: peptidase S14 [Clostridiaceae bacterium]|nr:peptidase S14 [Clostridiaceae bacterium]
MANFWNFVKNEENENDIELRISGEIADDEDVWLYEWFGIPHASPNVFREELKKYKGKNIIVWIDSYGGSVFAGASIYNALKEHKGKVITKIDGKAMSAASVIAMAGYEIHMSPASIMMIHNPLGRIDWGEAKDMRKAADVLDEVKKTIINAYQLKTKQPRNKISEMMDNETFMSPKTAIKEGFADKVLYVRANEPTELIENNFIFSRMAIQNSISGSMKKFLKVAKGNNLLDDNQMQQGNLIMLKSVNELREKCPDLVKQIENAAREAGAKAERSRIQDIEKISQSLAPELVNKAKFTEPIDAKELAFQAIQMDNGKNKKYLDDLKNDSAESGTDDVDSVPVEQKTEAEKKAVDSIAAGGNKRRGKQ